MGKSDKKCACTIQDARQVEYALAWGKDFLKRCASSDIKMHLGMNSFVDVASSRYKSMAIALMNISEYMRIYQNM